jgi:hypothetical protein
VEVAKPSEQRGRLGVAAHLFGVGRGPWLQPDRSRLVIPERRSEDGVAFRKGTGVEIVVPGLDLSGIIEVDAVRLHRGEDRLGRAEP